MIRIRIYGCSDKKVLKQCLTQASVYFLDTLLPKKRNIEILIKVVDNLIGTESAYGECYNYSNRRRPSNYVIQLDAGLIPAGILATLAHEMVHIKQFDKKELKFLVHCNKWKGERFGKEVAYADFPWEHEAELLEVELSNSFKEAYPKFNDFLAVPLP